MYDTQIFHTKIKQIYKLHKLVYPIIHFEKKNISYGLIFLHINFGTISDMNWVVGSYKKALFVAILQKTMTK